MTFGPSAAVKRAGYDSGVLRSKLHILGGDPNLIISGRDSLNAESGYEIAGQAVRGSVLVHLVMLQWICICYDDMPIIRAGRRNGEAKITSYINGIVHNIKCS